MPAFSKRSEKRLNTCHHELITLAEAVVIDIDCTVSYGHRNKEDQDEAHRLGRSTKKWPYSRHNQFPSDAIDLVIYPIDWTDFNRFAWFAGYVAAKAVELGIKIRWGCDWDMDTFTKDHKFKDFCHFERVL